MRPIQVAADIRSRMYELETDCRIERLTPTPDGVTVEIAAVGLAEADSLASVLGRAYPDVNITIVWHEPLPTA